MPAAFDRPRTVVSSVNVDGIRAWMQVRAVSIRVFSRIVINFLRGAFSNRQTFSNRQILIGIYICILFGSVIDEYEIKCKSAK